MVALFLDDNKTNNDGHGEEIGKNDVFILTNNNSARVSHYFVHIFAALRHYDMKLNFTSPLYGVGVNTTQKSSLSFSKLK